jgi:hypothetical protein
MVQATNVDFVWHRLGVGGELLLEDERVGGFLVSMQWVGGSVEVDLVLRRVSFVD